MAKILFRDQGYRFMFSSDVEREHVIVFNWDGEARYWLVPDVELEDNDKFSRLELELSSVRNSTIVLILLCQIRILVFEQRQVSFTSHAVNTSV